MNFRPTNPQKGKVYVRYGKSETKNTIKHLLGTIYHNIITFFFFIHFICDFNIPVWGITKTIFEAKEATSMPEREIQRKKTKILKNTLKIITQKQQVVALLYVASDTHSQ